MIKNLKSIIKRLFWKFGFKIEKVVIPEEYNLTAPELPLLKCLRNSKGILHFGAHRGSEAASYEWFGKKVYWFEANPKIFLDLKNNLKVYPYQKAICALISDESDKIETFKISNNDGASSSIFDFGYLSSGSQTLWPNKKKLKMTNIINLKTSTIDDLILKNKIEIKSYNHWVLDLQGAELLALKGADKSIEYCKSLFIEVSKGEVYQNAAQYHEIKEFLLKKGFKQSWEPYNEHTNVLFERF